MFVWQISQTFQMLWFPLERCCFQSPVLNDDLIVFLNPCREILVQYCNFCRHVLLWWCNFPFLKDHVSHSVNIEMLAAAVIHKFQLGHYYNAVDIVVNLTSPEWKFVERNKKTGIYVFTRLLQIIWKNCLILCTGYVVLQNMCSTVLCACLRKR
jgi:hypothetical protein